MTGDRGQETGNRKQVIQGSRVFCLLSPVSYLLPPGSRVVSCLLTAALLALAIFAHGCHSGDHDDEPLFAPPARQQEPPP
jgi:hypothetical protein